MRKMFLALVKNAVNIDLSKLLTLGSRLRVTFTDHFMSESLMQTKGAERFSEPVIVILIFRFGSGLVPIWRRILPFGSTP